MIQYSFTSTETRRLVRTDSPDGHIDSHTAPELCVFLFGFVLNDITVMVDWVLKNNYRSFTHTFASQSADISTVFTTRTTLTGDTKDCCKLDEDMSCDFSIAGFVRHRLPMPL